MNDNDRPRRAANAHLAHQLSAHGRQVTPRAHNTHDLGAYVRTTEDGRLAYPHPVSAAERTGNVVEKKWADPLAKPRKGRVQASDGSVQRVPALEEGFRDSFVDARSADPQHFSVKVAYGRSPLADGSNTGQPTWTSENVARSAPDFLGSALANGELHKANPSIPALSERSSSQTHVRLDLLNLTERPATSYGYSWGSNDKQPLRRRNEAQVID